MHASRPGYHFTAPAGNINDPYGVVRIGERYHMFHQLNPHAPQWNERCHWGHADSTDLVRWRRLDVALAPDGVDHGCWSGSVAVTDDAVTLLYTGVAAGALHRGRISAAHHSGDANLLTWTRDGSLIDGPPDGIGVLHFRDPFVFRQGAGWRMVVGAGLVDDVAAALQYSSPDLRNWTFDGVLCSRPSTDRDGDWTGSVWECPQLFELDGSWVLVVSVWSADVTEHVAYAVGDYDGATFTPRSWHRFAHGDAYYATTCFVDAQGRRSAMSWCREPGPVATGQTWAGALSVPHLLGLDDGLLTVTPHPDVDTLRVGRSVTSASGESIMVPEQADIVLEVDLDGRLELMFDGPGPFGMSLDRASGLLLLRLPGQDDHPVPLGADARGRVGVRILLDADVVEVFTPAAVAAIRVRGRVGHGRLTIDGSGRATATVHPMQSWFDR